MKKFFICLIFFMFLLLSICYWHKIIEFLNHEGKEILTTIIGGSIGGLITYLYVIHVENRKEARALRRENHKDELERKEKCTRSLLNTQMAISVQMDASRSVEEVVNKILYFKVLGVTLEEHLKDSQKISDQASILRDLIQRKACPVLELMTLANYILIPAAENNIVALPYEIFTFPTITLTKKVIIPELVGYFQKLVSCNKKYATIISLIGRNNEIRDSVINQPILQGKTEISTQIIEQDIHRYLMVIASMFTLAVNLKNIITEYFERADSVFIKTAHYIELLGISEAIKPGRDENGKIIFDKV